LSSGLWGQFLEGVHEPSICDLIFITNRRSSSQLTMSRSYLSLRWVVWSYTRWSNIDVNSRIWMLRIDCEHPRIEALRVIRKFSVVVLESSYTWFLLGWLDDPASNHKSRSIRVKWLSPYLFFNRLLYVSWKEKINISNLKK